MTEHALLRIRNLNVKYSVEGEVVRAVNDLELHLEEGESLGLVGETGAGKTTTALSILGLIPSPPGEIEEGEIFYNGIDLLTQSDDEMRKIRGDEISMIFQDPMTSLNPVYTVGDQIAEMILLHDTKDKKEARKKAEEMLETVGIPKNRYDEYPHQFSGGMKQRVVIAISLACSPKLILADEPTTALDVTIQAQILELMRSLRDEFGTSMLLITHDLGVVAQVCDRVAIMYAGEVLETGTIEEIFTHPHHPYTIGLFDSIPMLDKEVDKLKPIKGQMPDPTDLPEGCVFHPRCPYRDDMCAHTVPQLTKVGEKQYVKCLAHEGKFEAPKLMEEVKNGR